MASIEKHEGKPHVCPPSNAIHPADRWESLFVYSFICKFTNLRHKVEGLETPMDLEEALMTKEPNNILSQILVQFVVNLKPQTRNLSTDQISTTVASVLSEYFKSSERTIFWDDSLKANVDPFNDLEGGFFSTSWDFKLKILRQMVELQLTHAPDIKATIDNAWGVVHNKHKKNHVSVLPLDPTDPKSQERLQLLPIGQDFQRKRYWIADDSPRIYVSTNPWKITATFETVSSTREEYLDIIETLKSSAPPEAKKAGKKTKLENAHLALIAALEARIETIDVELARVQRVRKKIETKRTLLAQAEVRQTRTRRRTNKPDYVYNNELGSEDDGADDYNYQEEELQDEEYDQEFLNDSRRGRGSAATGTRRSTRTSAINANATSTVNANGKREGSSDRPFWRGDGPSIQIIGSKAYLVDRPSKRARTEESTGSAYSTDGPAAETHGMANGVRVKTGGAAALKPTEIAMEQIAGKKKSRFWVYAVEPVPSPRLPTPDPPNLDATLYENDGVGDEDRSLDQRSSRSPEITEMNGHGRGMSNDLDGGGHSPMQT